MNIFCNIFGHKFKSGWVGAKSSYFGAVVVNLNTCQRCGHTEYEYSTNVSLKGVNEQ